MAQFTKKQVTKDEIRDLMLNDPRIENKHNVYETIRRNRQRAWNNEQLRRKIQREKEEAEMKAQLDKENAGVLKSTEELLEHAQRTGRFEDMVAYETAKVREGIGSTRELEMLAEDERRNQERQSYLQDLETHNSEIYGDGVLNGREKNNGSNGY